MFSSVTGMCKKQWPHPVCIDRSASTYPSEKKKPLVNVVARLLLLIAASSQRLYVSSSAAQVVKSLLRVYIKFRV